MLSSLFQKCYKSYIGTTSHIHDAVTSSEAFFKDYKTFNKLSRKKIIVRFIITYMYEVADIEKITLIRNENILD